MSAVPAPAREPVPVLEIGGTHVTAALVDPVAGEVLPGSAHRDRLDADGSAPEVIGAVLRCAARLPVAAGALWGVAVPGPFDYAAGVALFEGVGKFDALYGTDVRAELTEGLPYRPAGVAFLNDADAFLLGEWVSGAAAGQRRCAGLTLGTGVGSAFLVDGVPVDQGPGVPPQGRADLLEADGRPLEDTVSRRAIRSAYARRTGTGGSDVPDVAEIAARAAGGEEAAHSVLETAFGTLGAVLGPWLGEFGAGVLVVGGSMTGSWDLLGPPLVAGLRQAGGAAAARLEVRVAVRPDRSALIGAARHAVAGRPR